MTIWEKYKIIKNISNKGNIKTYQVKFEPFITEIIPKDKNEYDLILSNLQNYQDKIIELIEENNKLYIVSFEDNINLNDINIIKEVHIKNNNIITKSKINELFNMESAMCKINTDNMEGEKQGTGFFIKINDNKKGLLTNYHVLNNIQLNTNIHIEYLSKKRKLKITEDRRIYSNEQLDYTFIEILKGDGVKDFFEIYPKDDDLNDKDIYILQYPKNNEISLSSGKIISKITKK